MTSWLDQLLLGFRFESPWMLGALILLPIWAWLRGRYAPVAAFPQPVRRVRQILYGVHPQVHVVEVGVSLTVSRRSADVGEEHGEAPTEQILRHGGERGA